MDSVINAKLNEGKLQLHQYKEWSCKAADLLQMKKKTDCKGKEWLFTKIDLIVHSMNPLIFPMRIILKFTANCWCHKPPAGMFSIRVKPKNSFKMCFWAKANPTWLEGGVSLETKMHFFDENLLKKTFLATPWKLQK